MQLDCNEQELHKKQSGEASTYHLVSAVGDLLGLVLVVAEDAAYEQSANGFQLLIVWQHTSTERNAVSHLFLFLPQGCTPTQSATHLCSMFTSDKNKIFRTDRIKCI
jgi:hypothetical protein